ncbi:hypothetical protein [Lysinibacillus xylanilyticus]|uniref:hypothetical protein n=1 Tax=Lysinibacillus xylanilyticus TaxID=582475 RepID=UPI003CFD6FA2
MQTKLNTIDVSIEQLAHDLSLVRLNKMDKDQVKTIGDMFEQYLEGVDTFKTLIKGYQDGSIKTR